ncbi:MAG: nodulation protein NfeD [Bacteroidetes bacterium]|nr:nodulation protein NfeD [Rhodothermia bacterium]MCS7154467.1 nodulation protein NfeD [Bacteroidota bacterium]MCX7906840.1 nodulation protein NfeD [Bacteroidota bacterium]MDW8136881.1 nodulation protein NfeD [Bacteroidota bacterium]MDW8285249.1 nodulation protein NfeD [Bacteroidota bacterium]
MSMFWPLILGIALAAEAPRPQRVYWLEVRGAIGPAVVEYIERGLKEAEADSALLVIALDTPGGLLESTRAIVQRLLNARAPVVVFVHPSGARAGSAGVFITLAAHVAAMAPGTNIGAAHPVGLGGAADTASVMMEKATNDAAAFARAVAARRGRNVAWAEEAVRRSLSSSETEALEAGAIDLVASSAKELLEQLHGRLVQLPQGAVRLRTSGAEIESRPMNLRERVLAVLSDPNVAYLLLLVGFYGILFELYNPGALLPGILGAIALIVAGYALQMLPVNYAGLALIALAIGLFIAEIKVASYGLLTLGGLVSLALGSLMLFRSSPAGEIAISLPTLLVGLGATAGFFLFVLAMGLRAQRRPPQTGSEALLGAEGIVISPIRPPDVGQVRVHGEIWEAASEAPLEAGTSVRVRAIQDLTLWVEAIPPRETN